MGKQTDYSSTASSISKSQLSPDLECGFRSSLSHDARLSFESGSASETAVVVMSPFGVPALIAKDPDTTRTALTEIDNAGTGEFSPLYPPYADAYDLKLPLPHPPHPKSHLAGHPAVDDIDSSTEHRGLDWSRRSIVRCQIRHYPNGLSRVEAFLCAR